MNCTENKIVEMTICMGSSCYARGNGDNLEVIEHYMDEHGLDAHVNLVGSRCENCCSDGPNLTVNGKRFQRVDRETLLEILKQTCPGEGANNE